MSREEAGGRVAEARWGVFMKMKTNLDTAVVETANSTKKLNAPELKHVEDVVNP